MHNDNIDNSPYKKIKYDDNSPALMRKRYWSPRRKKISRISSK